MRVLRISHSGVVDAWRERERALRRRDVDVRLLTAQVWDEAGAPVPLKPRDGEDVVGVRTVGSHPALFAYDPRPIWRALGERWDLVDIHEEPFALATAEVLLLRALRRQRAPYTLYSAQNLEKRLPAPFRWLRAWSLRGARGVSVCNTEAGRIVQAQGFPGLADVIPLGVDVAAFAPTGGRGHGKVVGYAGRLASHKGVDVLLEAVAGLPDAELRIAGSGPEEDSVRARADQPDLRGRVTFLGMLDGEALAGFYESLDVLAVPSLTTPGWVEQFGRVAVEAMAAGVPVVSSDSGALPDVVGGAGLLVPAGDPAKLRIALSSVLTDPALADRLRHDGLGRAAECDWEAVADRYLEMYRRATHQPGDRAEGDPAVVVVAYGSPEVLRRTLAPLQPSAAADEPVLVVDNSSSAEVEQVCREAGAEYLDAGRNGGFGAGVNIALSRVEPGRDVLLLNPDAVITRRDIGRLKQALDDDPGLASVSPTLQDGEGRPARVAWPFPSPVGAWLEAVGLGRVRDRRADYVVGTVMLLRGSAIRQVGGFDERFFLYAEETDWARRAARLGWRHATVSSVTATHVGAATSSDPARRETHFHGSQERYFRKHHGALGWQGARAAQLAGAGVRSLVLPGVRGRAARERFSLYVRGPARVEGRLTAASRAGSA